MSANVSPNRQTELKTAASVEELDAEVEGVLEESSQASDETDSDRRRRICESAYRRAEARGFAPGQELDDWLEAEREIQSGDRR